MTEFISHEIQVSVPGCGKGEQTYDLVQGNSPVNDKRRDVFAHGSIHILVYEPEYDCFITNQRLIVTLGIGYGVLVPALVGKLIENIPHMPILVPQLLDPFDPMISNSHAQAEIKAYSSHFPRIGKCWHAANIFSQGDGAGIAFVDQLVGQTQVGDGIFILVPVKIVAVLGEITPHAMIVIHHGSDPVKAESVQVEFFHPVFYV